MGCSTRDTSPSDLHIMTLHQRDAGADSLEFEQNTLVCAKCVWLKIEICVCACVFARVRACVGGCVRACGRKSVETHSLR